MAERKKYETEALRLARAIDLAIDSFKTHVPIDFDKAGIDHIIKVYSEWKTAILNPLPQYRKLASLKYKVADVFTFFQESSGETVDYFWKQIDKEGLGYLREDKLRRILDRGKIKGRIEYELAIDLIAVAEQEGRFTEEESGRLSTMIREFENRKKR
ncbi:hypothetical protein [Hymenobacter daeguensis]